jgi:hypothetical protein
MAAASKNFYLGAAIFAGAAALAAALAMLIRFPLRPSHVVLEWLWLIARTGIAAGLSAGLSFGLISWTGFRVRRGLLLWRAALLGTATVFGSHLLVGFVSALLVLPENMLRPYGSFNFTRDIIEASLGASLYSIMLAWHLTLPLGIAAAALVEWLEERRCTKSPSPSSA